MRYRVELVEERTGRLVYQDSRVSEYRGRDVDYSNTTSHLLDDGYYTAVVFLHTGGQNTSSSPHRLPLVHESKLFSVFIIIIDNAFKDTEEPAENTPGESIIYMKSLIPATYNRFSQRRNNWEWQ